MGASLSAQLVYGYDLGAPEHTDFLLRRADGVAVKPAVDDDGYDGDYGDPSDFDWYDDSRRPSLVDAIHAQLLRVMDGMAVTDDGYDDRLDEDAVFARIGVKVLVCGYQGSYRALIAYESKDSRGSDPLGIDPDELVSLHAEGGWDAKLAAALSALGAIAKGQPNPRWLILPTYF
jgi:hypothetical protein